VHAVEPAYQICFAVVNAPASQVLPAEVGAAGGNTRDPAVRHTYRCDHDQRCDDAVKMTAKNNHLHVLGHWP